MHNLIKLSLSNKLALIAASILLLAITLFGWLIANNQGKMLLDLKKNELAVLANGLAIASKPYLIVKDITAIETLLLSSSSYPDIKRICVINAAGYIQSEIARDKKGQTHPTHSYKKLNLPKNIETVIETEQNHLIIWQPIHLAGEVLGWIRIYSSIESLENIRSNLWQTISIIGLLIFLVSFVVLFFYISYKLMNIRAASEFAHLLPEKLGAQLIYKESSEEIANLISALNWASDKLKQQKIKLEKSHYELEQKVQERTQELEISTRLAEKANKAKSEFLSSMSHELRTPLNAILGFSQLLEIDREHPLNEKQLNSIEHIIEAGEHLLQLINGILDLAQIETGKIKLNLTKINIHSLLQHVISLTSPLLAENQLSLEFDAEKNPNLSITTDKLRLTQILINLVSNAIKYNKPQGKIVVTTEVVEDNIKIVIADTGIGIAEDQREKIFTAFERVAYDFVSGTGIGLYVCKRIMEILGGEIDYESRLGEGTRFWIVIGNYTENKQSNLH